MRSHQGRTPPATRLSTVLLLMAGLVAACGAGQAGESTGAGGLRGTVTVLAASSLTDTFTELGRRLERSHPGLRVRFSFAASSELATQVVNGAPSDAFAAASDATMDQVVKAGAVEGRPHVFATNRLQIAVPAGNPGNVRGLADLARPELTIALCPQEVPCGAVAADAFAAAGITPRPDTFEPDAKAALAKVVLGEVDAAVVYATDVRAAGDRVRGIDLPADLPATTTYPIAALAGAPNPEAARAFVDLVRSPTGQEVLAAAGFGRP